MIRALALAAALIALSGAPVASLDVGAKIGPVLMNPGAIICDTAEDAFDAVGKIDGESFGIPASCGRLVVRLPAFMEVVGHRTTVKNTYAILKVMFLPPASLGVQYGWVLDSPEGVRI